MKNLKKIVLSLVVVVMALSVAAPALAGCAPWCTPRCHTLCKEYFCYAVEGTFHSENGVTTFTIAEITDDQGAEVPYLRGMTVLVNADSEVGVETENYKAHFTYNEGVATQIVLHQPAAVAAK
jgi:hypothetical protein